MPTVKERLLEAHRQDIRGALTEHRNSNPLFMEAFTELDRLEKLVGAGVTVQATLTELLQRLDRMLDAGDRQLDALEQIAADVSVAVASLNTERAN